MMRPKRARSMPFEARLTTRKVPPRFVATTLSKSSSLMRRSSVSFVMPGVRDDDLDRTELLLHLGERGVESRGIRHVRTDGERALRSFPAAGGDGDPVPDAHEALCDGAADAAIACR